MLTLLFAALLAHAPAGVPTANQVAHEARAEAQVAVIEHRGDAALRDKLVQSMEVWHDAGSFLVGAADPALLQVLAERGIASKALPSVLTDDELFVVDLSSPAVCAALGSTAELAYEHTGQGLLVLPAGTTPRPAGFEPGRTCHEGLVAVKRQAWLPMRTPTLFGGRPITTKAAAPDARISSLVAAASKIGIDSDVQMLSSNFSRLSSVAAYIDAARNQIIARLQSMGYSPQIVQWSASHGDNIRVDIPGATAPTEWVVIGAHYDSINGQGSSFTAPGADDNGSGSAAVIEIARVLKTAGPFERSIRLMWFSGEEFGLLGSDAAANASATSGEDIVGMINTDMNAYRANGDTRDVDFATNSTSSALTQFCNAMGQQYVTGWLSTFGVLTAGTSDHASYTTYGYASAFPFEDLSQYSPYIHTANDSYPQSTPDFDLSLLLTRGVIASAATLAEPVDMSISHTPLPDTTNASGPYVVSAQVTSLISSTVTSVELHYWAGNQTPTVVPMTFNGGSNWSGAIPSQGSPVTISYFIYATDSYAYPETLPSGADTGGEPFKFFVGTKNVLYAHGFEGGNDAGWTHAQVATQDDWQRGVPQGSAGDPSAAFAGTTVWGNDLGAPGWNGAYGNNVENWLRSPVLNLSAANNVTLEFRRWLTIEEGQFDQASVRVNGQVVWQNPNIGDLLDSSWVPMSLDVSNIAAHNASVQVEFRLKSDGGVTFGGWNLDAFELVELGPGTGGCPTPSLYCTSKAASIPGCVPTLSYAGAPSASAGSGFTLSAGPVPGLKPGLWLHTTQGAAVTPIQNAFGFLCINTNGMQRFQPGPSNGSNGLCDGQYAFDFNQWVATQTQNPSLVAGATVDVQCWYRDPPSAGGANLTNAMHFLLCP
jgi:Peptidase family M28